MSGYEKELLLECPECGTEKGEHYRADTWKTWALHLRKCFVIQDWEMKFYVMEGGMSRQEAYEYTVKRMVGGRRTTGHIQDRRGPRDSAQRKESTQGHIESEGSQRGKEHRPYT